MKRLLLLLSFLPAVVLGANVDPYEQLAQKLSTMAAKKMSDKKIAILTFEYVDGRASSGGRAVSEKLTNRFVELGEFTVIERGMVEKVMAELEFQNKGTVDPDAAKKLGKGLGVEAIVTGTLSDGSYNNVEINARVIKTETYEIVAAATTKVKKTWSDEPAPQAASSYESAPASSSMMKRSGSSSRPTNMRGYFNLIIGASNATMDAEFTNSYSLLRAQDFGSQFVIPIGVPSVKITGMTTGNSAPIGLRVGVFGEILGGAFEMGTFKHSTLRQSGAIAIGGLSGTLPLPDGFLTVSTFHMSGDLMMKFPTGEKVYPYFGLGMGLSINTVTSSFVRMSTAYTPLNETAPGFLFRVPIGMRFNLSDQLGFFFEGRFWMNTFTFNRGLKGETDTITMQGSQFLMGAGLLF